MHADLFQPTANFGDREKVRISPRPDRYCTSRSANWHDVNPDKGAFMKMHLVLTAAFAALCSHAAFAASEGGDTWSAAQPQAAARSPRPLAITTSASFSSPQGFPVPASEGGDTWSAVNSQATARSTPSSPVVATTAPLSTLQRDYPEYRTAYGSPAEPDSADRIVRVSRSLHSVNVAHGETVKFVVDGENGSERSFTWRFDVSPVLTHLDLSEVAPADLPAHNVRVFVAPDSTYRGG
jgi:Heavy-metal resistance protein CzcE